MEPSPDEDAHDYVPPAAPVETGTSGEDLAAAGMPRHISPHSLPHAAITNSPDAEVPLRDAQVLARHADPRTTEH